MNGPLEQITALTCHGNAAIAGSQLTPFFPVNSSCQFCESIVFVELRKKLFGKRTPVIVANTPDEWFSALVKRRATAIRLVHYSGDDPSVSDRMTAGLIGGGGSWMMEVLNRSGKSEYWEGRWDIGDRDESERRIWRVSYALVGTARTEPDWRRTPEKILTDLRKSLESIYAFAVRENCGGFIQCFANALRALEMEVEGIASSNIPDLALPDQLNTVEGALLNAASRTWVFGGMGSWNDMSFNGTIHEEYERLSEDLYRLLSEAVEVAASSTAPTLDPTYA